jgi:hypothetical protein
MLDDFKGTVLKKKSNEGEKKLAHKMKKRYEYLFLSEESMKYCPNLINFGQKQKVFKSYTFILDRIEMSK